MLLIRQGLRSALPKRGEPDGVGNRAMPPEAASKVAPDAARAEDRLGRRTNADLILCAQISSKLLANIA